MKSPSRPLALVGRAVRPSLGAVPVPGAAHPLPVVLRAIGHPHGRPELRRAHARELVPPVHEEGVRLPRERLARGLECLVDLLREPRVPGPLLPKRPADPVQLRVVGGLLLVGGKFLLVVLEVLVSDGYDGLIVEQVLDRPEAPVLVEDVDEGLEAEGLVGRGRQAEVLDVHLPLGLRVRRLPGQGLVDEVDEPHDLVVVQLLAVLEDEAEPLDHPRPADALRPRLRHVQVGRAVPDEPRPEARERLLDAHGLVDDAGVDLGELAEHYRDEREDDASGDLVPDEQRGHGVQELRKVHVCDGPSGLELDLDAIVHSGLGVPDVIHNGVDSPGHKVPDGLDGHAAQLARMRPRLDRAGGPRGALASAAVGVLEVNVDACSGDPYRDTPVSNVIKDVLIDADVRRVQRQGGYVARRLDEHRVVEELEQRQ
mmetsp:Transcript_2571/g.7904  ORF Transcript_2571/g.7904 Transcript_2571/m.7904 type:complete len:427 (+) Transcript_2571:741-2021(+)